MNRELDIGDRVVCEESGVIGKILKFYTPTSCEEQTMVETDDGRKYHAPTSTWVKTTEAGNTTIFIGGMRNFGKTVDYEIKRALKERM